MKWPASQWCKNEKAMNMNRLILITGILIAAIAVLSAGTPPATTYTIKGSVLDKSTWKPVEGALVHLIREEVRERTSQTDQAGKFRFTGLAPGKYAVEVEKLGWQAKRSGTLQLSDHDMSVTITLNRQAVTEPPVSVVKEPEQHVGSQPKNTVEEELEVQYDMAEKSAVRALGIVAMPPVHGEFNTEQYDHLPENEFRSALREPLSTFSIDVDRASYSNTRRFLNNGEMPPVDAVRIEEFINYFEYDYPAPAGDDPLSIYSELSECPWNKDHELLMVGIKAREIKTADLPPMNLTFLIDVSGSMRHSSKLPLLKNGMRLLVDQMRPVDRVAIVVYAGAAGLVLPSTSGADKQVILDAIERLQAGGSTAGAQGIKLAYDVTQTNFKQNGNNRVILATDGDFNVGMSSDGELVRLIEEKRESGVFLTVLGFGTGNLKDSRMEKLADKGNGNYAYIDNIQEARKVLVSEMGATMYTVAKDVKIQVEFNPAKVSSYKLIGYENRLLKNEDFNNDKKDAGEVGSGHTVTALYELVPAGTEEIFATTDPLKYQRSELTQGGNELLTLKLRYKHPRSSDSELMTEVVRDRSVKLSNTSKDFRFASSVAMFGMILRGSEHKGESNYGSVVDLAKGSRGEDENGYRSEFIRLVELASLLKPM